MNEIAPRDASGGLLNFIERASRDPEFDVHKLGELLRMQRELVDQQAQREFNAAMAAAQTVMLPIIRDAQNPHTKSRYAKLETIDREMRPIYTRHGFAVRFGSAPSPREGWIRIVCTVSHTGGCSEVNYLDAPPDDVGARGGSSKTGVQGVGSAVTYLRRYLLCMVFNIVLADQDDDGEGKRQLSRREQINADIPIDPLEVRSLAQWRINFRAALAGAQTLADVEAISGHRRVLDALNTAPEPIRVEVERALAEAHERFKPAEDWPDDPIRELIAEVQEMDLVQLNQLRTDAAWIVRVKDAVVIPPDEDRLNEAIAERKAELQG